MSRAALRSAASATSAVFGTLSGGGGWSEADETFAEGGSAMFAGSSSKASKRRDICSSLAKGILLEEFVLLIGDKELGRIQAAQQTVIAVLASLGIRLGIHLGTAFRKG